MGLWFTNIYIMENPYQSHEKIHFVGCILPPSLKFLPLASWWDLSADGFHQHVGWRKHASEIGILPPIIHINTETYIYIYIYIYIHTHKREIEKPE